MKIVKLLESLGNTWIDILPINLNGNEFCFADDRSSQIIALKSTLNVSKESSAEECMNKMITKYKAESFSKTDQKIVCSVRYNMDKNGGYHAKATPYVLSDSVSKEAVIIISEKAESLKGIRIHTSLIRKYINGEIAPHIVGYTGFMSSEEYEKRKES